MSIIQNMVARLTLDSGPFERGARSSTQSMRGLQAASLSLQRQVLQAAGAYLGARGLIRALTDVTRVAMRAQESENLFTVSLKGNAAEARTWSQQIAQSLRLNEYAVREQVATFNTMFDSLGLGSRDAYEMAKALTVLSKDMASFFNLRPEEAFQKLQSGITGEVEPLKRLGIIVNETTIKQYALRQGWIKSGETLTELEKIYARYGVIVEQTRNAQGDLLRTQDSAANTMRGLNEIWTESKIVLGESLLPAVTEVAGAMSDWLSSNRSEIKRWASDTVEGLTMVAGAYKWYYEHIPARMIYRALTNSPEPPVTDTRAEWMRDFSNVFPGAGTTGGTREGFDYVRIDPKTGYPPGMAPPPPALAPPPTNGEGAKELAKATTQTTRDIWAAYARMYDQIDTRSEESFNLRTQILLRQAAEYKQMGIEASAVDEWFVSQHRKLMEEAEKATDDFFAGFRAGVSELQRDLPTLGDLGADIAHTMSEGFGDVFKSALRGAHDLGDVIENLGMRVADLFAEFAGKQLFGGITQLLGFGSEMHAGGDVGIGSYPQRALPAAVWAAAPRFKNGLEPGEFPAVLHAGERVTSAPNVRRQDELMARMVALLSRIEANQQLERQPQPVYLDVAAAFEAGAKTRRGVQQIRNIVERG